MEVLLASAVGVLVAAGIYLVLRSRTFSVILGLGLLGYAANFFIFASGRLRVGLAPIISDGTIDYPDPLPQALVLTAIVIGFGMTAFLVVLGLRADGDLGTDHVDGAEPVASNGGGPAAASGGDAAGKGAEE